MATSKEFLRALLAHWQAEDAADTRGCALLPDGAPLRTRSMMGEYCLYYRNIVVGGVYDDRLLSKNTPTARALLPDAPLAIPYDGARPMLHVSDTTDSARICTLFAAVAADLPAQKPRKT